MKYYFKWKWPFIFKNEVVIDGNVTFWKNTNGKFIYILMSRKLKSEHFTNVFPLAVQIEESEFQKLHDMENGPEVVTVGDEGIINEHFADREEPIEQN